MFDFTRVYRGTDAAIKLWQQDLAHSSELTYIQKGTLQYFMGVHSFWIAFLPVSLCPVMGLDCCSVWCQLNTPHCYQLNSMALVHASPPAPQF